MYCRRRWPEQCWCSDGTAVQESALSDGCSPFTCDNIFNANHIKRNENDFRWCKWQPCTLLVYKFCHVPPWPKAHGGQTGPNVYVVNNNYFIIHCNLIYTAIFQSSGTETNSKQEMNRKKTKKIRYWGIHCTYSCTIATFQMYILTSYIACQIAPSSAILTLTSKSRHPRT